MKKRILSTALAAAMILPFAGALSGCGTYKNAEIVLKVYNWEEYIDNGGEGSYLYDLLVEEGETPDKNDFPSIIDDFEDWYEETYNQTIRVEYSTFGTNEDMYNELVLGTEYDLLCPSEYMIMKLAAEHFLVPYDESFFDTSNELNYYARNVSPYIDGVFENGTVGILNEETGETEIHSWREYAAGYMWGTTGFIYTPNPKTDEEIDILYELENSEEYSGWGAFINPKFKNRITAKDNVRDTYFAALGVTYQDELLMLERGEDYNEELTKIFNRTDEEYIDEVYDTLMKMKENINGFETDTGKTDLVSGKIWLNYAWGGDAVYALDLAENEDDVELNYYVPEAGSNLYFDGWIMTKSVERSEKQKQAAQAFVNFLSMPENAMRNSYYIGYTSVISGENMEMLDYVEYLYGVEDEEDEIDENYYDLSYFFGEEAGIYADEEQRTCRQLYAQFPPEDVIERCAVMSYFEADANDRINELWARVKAESLDGWAIAVICVTIAAIVLFVVFVKFGGKIDFFPHKPKKGYRKVAPLQ